MIYKFFDEDGIIGIVNGDTYQGFVGSDWEFDSLMVRFVEEINNKNLIVWKAADYGNQWAFDIVSEKSEKQSFREFETTINVTENALYLIDYTSLTVIAQFKGKSVSSACSDSQKHVLENGLYHITVRQLFDPTEEDISDAEDFIHFEIVLHEQASDKSNKVDQIFWFD